MRTDQREWVLSTIYTGIVSPQVATLAGHRRLCLRTGLCWQWMMSHYEFNSKHR